MEAKLFRSLTTTKAPLLPIRLTPSKPSFLRLQPPRSRSGGGGGNASSASTDTDEGPDAAAARRDSPLITPPPETVEIRFRRRPSKKRAARRGSGDGGPAAPAAAKEKVKKKWEDMSMGEKAIELYVGEKGALYWLNKFAYASIFIVIGGWILFRFVGPALNLYQLDAPPLSPDAVLKGS